MVQLSYDIAGDQIDGARDYQEDAFLITHLSNTEEDQQALIVVADGMGGHAAGNVASNMAVQAFNKYVSSNYPVADGTSLPEVLRASVIKANDGLQETVKETAALSGMGCTMVGILLAEGKVWWASVGDSHLYLIRDNEITKLNADHSYGGFLDRMAAEGKQIEVDPSLSRNMLMSALTGGEIAEIDISEEPVLLQPNDILLVCSDGMDTLQRDEITKQAAWASNSKESTSALLKAVEDAQRPRQDNTTVVCVKSALIEPKTTAPAHDYAEEEEEEAPKKEPKKAKKKEKAASDGSTGSGGGLGLGKIIGIVVILAVALVGADFALKLGIIFSKPTKVEVVSAEEEPVEEPAEEIAVEESAPAEEESTPTESEETRTETVAKEPAAETQAPAPVLPKRKRPHIVNPFADKFKDGSLGPTMVTIPEGEFEMGASRLSANLDERPRHKVKLKKFHMSQFEITFTEYERFAKAMGKRSPERSQVNPQTTPVFNVSWQDAQDYASWLSRMTGKRYKLPTEAQWEYAARAGTTTSYWWGQDVGQNKAHCLGCGSPANMRAAAPIGIFDPNPWGLYDTSGNVAEWTRDCYNSSYDGAPSDGSAWEDGDCSKRVARGGSFSNAGTGSTNTRREKYPAGTKLTHIGFRVVRED